MLITDGVWFICVCIIKSNYIIIMNEKSRTIRFQVLIYLCSCFRAVCVIVTPLTISEAAVYFYWDLLHKLSWLFGPSVKIRSGLKMKAITRSVRHFRSALRHQTCNYCSGYARNRRQLINFSSGFGYRLNGNGEIRQILDPVFIFSKALSTDAVADTIGGVFLTLRTFISICACLHAFLSFFKDEQVKGFFFHSLFCFGYVLRNWI